jgi:predicted GTPase
MSSLGAGGGYGGFRRLVIAGAGGRDFHNFNVLYRHCAEVEVVAFTAAQIPFQSRRCYPASLAGARYPEGIPILDEAGLARIIANQAVDEVVFSYSDVPHQQLMEKASAVLAAGADFRLISPQHTQLRARRPVVAVCAVRTGCGKSPLSRYLCRVLQDAAYRPVVVRHPMAYGDLEGKGVQVFRELTDLDRWDATIEEREEFEPLIRLRAPVLAGVDYQAVLAQAEQLGDVLIWDGGNNDAAFFRPDLQIVLVDPLRPGDERSYYPGLVNLMLADVVVLAKSGGADRSAIDLVQRHVRQFRPGCVTVRGDLDVQVEAAETLAGRRVLVVEDGPSLSHGGMSYGAGVVAARRFGAAELVDPRPYAVGSLQRVFEDYPHLGPVLPAMGYSREQLRDLAATLEAVPCDLILCATPVDLRRLLSLATPLRMVHYEFIELDGDALARTVLERVAQSGGKAPPFVAR